VKAYLLKKTQEGAQKVEDPGSRVWNAKSAKEAVGRARRAAAPKGNVWSRETIPAASPARESK